jgi:tRNA(fMet)-specific endonuclease VapC
MHETGNESLPSIRYILDTDSVTYQQLGREAMVRQLAQVDPDVVATTVITMYEQLRGRLAAVNRKQSDQAMQAAYQRLQATHRYYCQVKVLPFDSPAAEKFRELVYLGLRIGAQDLKIAAIALIHQSTLVTSNRRHFNRIPGLSIEDWGIL